MRSSVGLRSLVGLRSSVGLRSLAVAFVLVATLAPAARADVFGPIGLVSESATQQAVYADDPAISADGRFVAFDGYYGGATGVWRRDLATGAVEQVAPGNALLPSISADGRYVSFTTTAALAPREDVNADPDVYVRDMALAAGRQESPECVAEEEGEAPAPHGGRCPYTLVSAVDGAATGLSYEAETASLGAVAAGRSAISSDGRHVAFVLTAPSNLVGAHTPAMQVAVRDTESEQTRLVSERAAPATGVPVLDPETGAPEPVPGVEGEAVGAVYQGEGAAFPPRTYGGYRPTTSLGASISADGSTVAWMGVNVPQQAHVLEGEAGDSRPKYTEPLWRRVADGPSAPTRRVTGGSDAEDPACAASGEAALLQTPSRSDPCQGPFFATLDEVDAGIWKNAAADENFVPQLSADGYTVAFLAQAPTLTRNEGFAAGLQDSDVYVADMHPGRTRVQALRALTELSSGKEELATTGPIVDLGISPDGSQVAFSTQRTRFTLSPPSFVSAPAGVPGMTELFDADLADNTLTRVTHGYLGEASEHPHSEESSSIDPYPFEGDGSLSPSFSADGNLLAFASTASNLVYGDGNTPPLVEGRVVQSVFDGADAFVLARIPATALVTEAYVSAPPAQPAFTPKWRLGVTAASLRDGQVRLYATVPGAGRLNAAAQGVLRSVRVVRGRAGAHRAVSVKRRSVASAGATAGAVGLVSLTLTLPSRYRALAASGKGLHATVAVTFSAPGHPGLTARLPAVFKRATRRGGR